ncbi:MAG: FAD-dependent oxidoreductase [Opitutales bacterium]
MKHHLLPPDVLVAGAGPVGLFQALTLTARGVPVRIVERSPGPGSQSYALALHPETLSALADFDLLASVMRFAHPLERIALYAEDERVAELDMGTAHAEFPYCAVLPQSALETILVEALARRGVEVEWNHRLSELQPAKGELRGAVQELSQRMMGYATSHLDWMVENERPFHVPFVVGADGHRSLTRALGRIPFPEVGPAQSFAVFEFETVQAIEPEVRLVFSEKGMSACWPLSTHRCRWSFETTGDGRLASLRSKEHDLVQLGADTFARVPPEELGRLLAERAPFFRAEPARVEWNVHVKFERRLADYFNDRRLCLVGDAAHLASPLGMHSMNQGMREAGRLAEVLSHILDDGDDRALLESWDGAARDDWRWLLGHTRVVEATKGVDERLLPYADLLPECLPASEAGISALLATLGMQVQHRTHAGVSAFPPV